MKPKQGFMAAVNSKFYIDLAKVKHDDPNRQNLQRDVTKKIFIEDFLEEEELSKK